MKLRDWLCLLIFILSFLVSSGSGQVEWPSHDSEQFSVNSSNPSPSSSPLFNKFFPSTLVVHTNSSTLKVQKPSTHLFLPSSSSSSSFSSSSPSSSSTSSSFSSSPSPASLSSSSPVSTSRPSHRPSSPHSPHSPFSANSKFCQFGNVTYKPEDKWKPNLGSPFGLLPCVLCQCVSLQKKTRTVLKVRCRNIVSQCPKANCSDPVLLPGRCCKVCQDSEVAEIDDDLVPLMNVDVESLCEKWRSVPRLYKKLLEKNRLCTPNTTIANSPETISPFTTSNLPPTFLVSSTSPSPLSVSSSSPLSTTIDSLKILSSTFSSVSSKSKVSSEDENNLMDMDASDSLAVDSPKICLYEDKKYEEGAQWKSSQNKCEMCFCQRGKIKCDSIICPIPKCDNPITPPGDCCPLCLEHDFNMNSTWDYASKGCYFEGDKKFHLVGSQWHPYIPPFGFDKCSICSCLAESLSITCKQSITCPALTCSPEEAYRENAGDCCKKCPNTIQMKSIDSSDELGDQSMGPRMRSANELISAGGCTFNGRVYPNGDEWHPYVAPFGEMRCVKCHCRSAKIRCSRIKCPRLSCRKSTVPEDHCCPVCAVDQANKFNG